MELIEALYSRRSVRSFHPTDVRPETVKTLLEAAVQAPSALDQQPWAFAVFQGRRRIAALEKRLRKFVLQDFPQVSELPTKAEVLASPERSILYGANAMIVIYATFGRLQPTEDCCLAAQNLMLAAHGMGLATCPIGFARYWFDLPETKKEMGISPACTAVFPLVLGYPTEAPPRKDRRDPRLLAWEFGS